ncbi:MAG: diaminopimelate epimerase [Synergistaceae bacterium]|nr:diaminopimelate epimerase [Synergistaceae bacterium]
MINCSKMNGNGNDFLVMDNMSLTLDGDELSRCARLLCRRREALGADGLLVAEPSSSADFKMRLFNRDGSEGEMCGNGARCIARFAFEKGIAPSEDMSFETLGGTVHAVAKGDRVTLDLAPVSLAGAVTDAKASVDGYEFSYTFLTVGVPHVVIFERERRRRFEDYAPLGRAIRGRLDLFPQGANVNFALLTEKRGGGLDVMTYERGVEDMTLSCGTGSTASAIAGLLLGVTGSEVEVVNPGGVNRVTLEFSDAETICPRLEGGALMIAEVSILPDALR